jgi:hypothetical protein
MTKLKWMLDSVHLEIVLILTQIGARFAPNIPQALTIVLDAPDGTPR